jgi:pyruvate/2-oxoglutarate dehydrogenase complex dihydrolipoamide dehydrogenase (E3) component
MAFVAIKMDRRSGALALSGLKSRKLYGVDLSLRREVTVADFLCHEEHVKEAFHASVRQSLQVLKATIYCGTCTFLDAHTIQVNLGSEDGKKDSSALGEEIQLRGEKILIATGSSRRFSFRSQRNLRFRYDPETRPHSQHSGGRRSRCDRR